MKRLTFDVAMLDPTESEPERVVEHRVTLVLGDQLRGELEGKKQGVDTDYPIHTSALWVWAAMHRLGHYSKPFQEFKSDCLDYDKVAEAELPPTPQAASSDSV